MNSSATKTTVNILNIPLGITAKEAFYPYISYINPNGDAKGLMFENFMFDVSSGTTLADWDENINRLFTTQGGISTLDDVAKDIKSILGLPSDKKLGVYIKAPLPKISLVPFGDINRDGFTKKLLDKEDCLKAFSAFLAEFRRHMVIYNPKNLEIKGWIFGEADDSEILKACENHLSEQGYKAYTNGIENLEITENTDFSSLIEASAELRIIYSETPDFIINCAFSQKSELRVVYDSLYILLNPDKFISESPIREPQPENVTTEGIVEPEIEEIKIEEPDAGYLAPAVDSPGKTLQQLFEELQANGEFDESDEVDIDDIDKAIEEAIKKALEESDESADEVFGEKLDEASIEEITEETDEEPKGITNEINLEISITPPESEAKVCPCAGKKCMEKDTEKVIEKDIEKDIEKAIEKEKLSKKQKCALIGAGIAAAALGLAYILGKSAKD